MANTKLVFLGQDPVLTGMELITFANVDNQICIQLEDTISNSFEYIYLDRATAIKFHRELKKQISFLESEVDNG